MEDKSLKKVIAKLEYTKGKAYLKDLEKENSSFNPYYKVAASIVVLLGLSVAAVFYINYPNSEDLFAENFEPYNNIVVPVDRSNVGKTMKERAFYYYESEQYKDALKVFDSLLSDTTNNTSVLNFYKANIFLQGNRNIKDAISLLEYNCNHTEYWKDKNLWYLSLAYLKANDKEKALKTLNTLNAIDSDFKKTQRLKLLKALE